MTYEVYTVELSSSQPAMLASKAKEAESLEMLLLLVAGVVGMSVVLFFLVWRRRYLSHFDVFSSKHTYEEGQAVTLQKTHVGGSFALVLLTVVLMLCASTFPQYWKDNTQESKNLVPRILMDSIHEFQAKLFVTVSVQDYHGSCVIDSNKCDLTISAVADQMEGFAVKSCFLGTDSCDVMFYCGQCILSSSSKVSFSFEDLESFGTALTVNVTTFSSIPNEFSTAIQTLLSRTCLSQPHRSRGSPAR